MHHGGKMIACQADALMDRLISPPYDIFKIVHGQG